MTKIEPNEIAILQKEIADLKEQNTSLLSMFDMTTTYLEKTRATLKASEEKLLRANKHLTDSINYARHIQDAFLAQADDLQKVLPNSFVLQKPRDIVSGDFVWFSNKSDVIYLGVGDCTGHGVPGAMLSVFMISMLNEIINYHKNLLPSQIIKDLDRIILKNLRKYSEKVQDSAEISLIAYDKTKQYLNFLGAKRPLVLVRNGVLTLYKGEKITLGNADKRVKDVQDTLVEVQEGDMLYMFSDGLSDQFGGEKNSRFTTKKLLSLLEEISSLPLGTQFDEINQRFVEWQGTNKQTDDIVIIGLKI
jgi:serine phosphatase RsbU (regulator of sigma subunit)